MKKKSILNLIRCHVENNELGFRSEAREIAREFDMLGDNQLAMYILSLLSSNDSIVPQNNMYHVVLDSPFLDKNINSNDVLMIPNLIMSDLIGIVNAINRRLGASKFLFQGKPGTGKTQAAIQIARLLGRDLFAVNESLLIDSKLGQTSKNINALFDTIRNANHPEKIIVLFDELDAIALDRTNSNDLREMGRAMTEILKGFDSLSEDIVVIATTNLYKYFDKALTRRFDFIVDFNRYTDEDLIEIAEKFLDYYLDKVKLANRDIRLFRKILNLSNPLPLPGDLRNIIKTSVAFSDPKNGYDYFRRLYMAFSGENDLDICELHNKKFTVREIEILTGLSKSLIGRELIGDKKHA